jgi:hypothetical protein
MEHKIYNDVVPKLYLNELQKILISQFLKWEFLLEVTASEDASNRIDDKNIIHTPAMVHLFRNRPSNEFSEHWPLIWPMKFFMEDKVGHSFDNIIRSKANLLLPSIRKGKEYFNMPHIDHYDTKDYVNVLFFPFDSDGDFFLFKENYKNGDAKTVNIEKRISPKENTMVVFDGWQYHSGSNPIEYPFRISLNTTIACQ